MRSRPPSVPIPLPAWAARLALVVAAAVELAAAGPDKSGYTWFNPTPAARLRELGTDRPDLTESPFTVDAGHAQIELDFATGTRNRLDGVRTSSWGVLPFNLRLGLTNNLEAGIFVSPVTRVAETPRGGPRARRSGFGDVTLRAKFNFWGNDGGATAGGLIADVTLPTAARGLGSDKLEGDLAVPAAFELAGGWEGGAMTALGIRHRDTGGAGAVWRNTVTFSHEVVKDVSGYAELTSTVGEGGHVATFDLGLAWKLNAHTQLDGGVNLGLSRQADDLTGFAGISRRF
jgi:hypothetical protein